MNINIIPLLFNRQAFSRQPYGLVPKDLSKNLSVLKKCKNKFVLFFEMFFLSTNSNPFLMNNVTQFVLEFLINFFPFFICFSLFFYYTFFTFLYRFTYFSLVTSLFLFLHKYSLILYRNYSKLNNDQSALETSFFTVDFCHKVF